MNYPTFIHCPSHYKHGHQVCVVKALPADVAVAFSVMVADDLYFCFPSMSTAEEFCLHYNSNHSDKYWHGMYKPIYSAESVYRRWLIDARQRMHVFA